MRGRIRLSPRPAGAPTPEEAAAWRAMGGQLRRVRESRGVSIERVADVAGIAPGTAAHIEAGRQRARVDSLERWLQLLGVDPYSFVVTHAAAVAPARMAPRRAWRSARKPPADISMPALRQSLLEAASSGAVLLRLRENRGLSRAELAHRLGVPRFTVWLAEHDRYRLPPHRLERWIDELAPPGAVALVEALYRGLLGGRFALGVPPGLVQRSPTQRRHHKR